jgi:hypothetical protein
MHQAGLSPANDFNASCLMACASIGGHKTQQWPGCGTPARARLGQRVSSSRVYLTTYVHHKISLFVFPYKNILQIIF